MPVKIQPEGKPPGSSEGRPVPYRKEPDELLKKHLQSTMVSAILKGGGTFNISGYEVRKLTKPVKAKQVDTAKQKPRAVKKAAKTGPKPATAPNTPAAPSPRKTAEVIPINSHPRREEITKRRLVRASKRGGGNGGGRCQDQEPRLKAWLAAYNPIPNNFCRIEDREKHIRASENRRKVRLMRYGDPEYRPSPPEEWHPVQRTEGWFGGRCPTVLELVQFSQKIARDLGDYVVDFNTRDFLFKNQGSTFLAYPCQDPEEYMRERGLDLVDEELVKRPQVLAGREKLVKHLVTDPYLKGWDAYQAEWPNVSFSPGNRKLTMTKEYVSSVVNKQVKEEPVKAIASSGEGFTLIGKPVEVWTRSFRDERRGNKRPQARSLGKPVAYKGVEVEPYHDAAYRANNAQYRELQFSVEYWNCFFTKEYDRKFNEEFASAYHAVNDDPMEESLTQVNGEWWDAETLTEDEQGLYHWLCASQGKPLVCELQARLISNFARQRVVLGKQYCHGGFSKFLLTCWFIDKAKAPDAMTSDFKWCQGTEFQHTLTADQQARWDEYRARQQAEWAALQESFIGPPQEGGDGWIIPPEEINALARAEENGPIIPHHEDIVERLAANSERRVKRATATSPDKTHYFALKKAFKSVGKSVKGFFTEEEPVWPPWGKGKDKTG